MRRLFLIPMTAMAVFFHLPQVIGLLPEVQATNGLAAQEIGFLEDFALAENRETALKQLVPGTEEFYFFHCLHYQHTEQLNKVDEFLQPWIKRFGYSTRVNQIRNRQAILKYSDDPDGTLKFLIQQLSLHFSHQREIPHTQRDLPSKLDPKTISIETLIDGAFSRYSNTQGFSDSGLRLLAQGAHDNLKPRDLNRDQRRHLLERLQYPSFPGLVELIVADLKDPNTGGFGSIEIHKKLTLKQLDEVAKQHSSVLNQGQFINTYLSKLAPSEDTDWRADTVAHEAYLGRMWTFVKSLSPAHNSMKANILFRRLEFNRTQGIHDRELFLEYLKLPREVGYINPVILKQLPDRNHIANIHQSFEAQTRLIPIVNEQPLVEYYLHHFLLDAADTKEFQPWFEENYLQTQFATVKILNGRGDSEKWAATLSPSQYQALLERIDLDFVATNAEHFDVDEDVLLELHTKNIKTLIVKVFEINAENFYRKNGREIDTNINLDGLVPNHEQTYQYDTEPALRVKREYTFPNLKDRGVYVVDFIAGGKSSRALIRKGRLHTTHQVTAAGLKFTVLDQDGMVVPDASLWIGGRRYAPAKSDKSGKILVPFSTQPGGTNAIIIHDDFSCLQTFQHAAEKYQFTAAMVLDRESLTRSNQSTLLLRPSLKLAGGEAVPVSLLQEPTLTITSTNLDGVSSTKIVSDLKLSETSETEVSFVVPPRTKTVQFAFTAMIESLSRGTKETVAASQQFAINQIDQTELIQDVHLAPTAAGYVLEVRGKTGEPRPKQSVRVSLQPTDFTFTVDAELQSDSNGQIELGPLANIGSISVSLSGGSNKSWPLGRSGQAYPQTVNALIGETIQFAAPANENSAIALFEIRDDKIVAEHTALITKKDRLLQISDLPAGDFQLQLTGVNDTSTGTRADHQITLRITDGRKSGNMLVGEHRILESRPRLPLQIVSAEIVTAKIDDDKEEPKKDAKKEPKKDVKKVEAKVIQQLRIQLVNSNSTTRVHVFADRYQPAFDAYQNLASVRAAEPWEYEPSLRQSVYLEGRKIGEEYQYILDRKYVSKYPGNMLDRPSLLLNPWATRDTDNSTQVAQDGSDFGARGNEADKPLSKLGGSAANNGHNTDSSNLDFLGDQSVLLANLKPDADGLLTIDLDKLGSAQHIRIVALDAFATVQRSISGELLPLKPRDSRLADAFDPEKHFSLRKQIEVMKADEELVIEDIVSAKFQTYDDLSDVYRLLIALNPNSDLKTFEFVLTWDQQDDKKKRTLYSKHACHELNFFLQKKDAPFFAEVVRPHLEFKRDKQFIDHFLLDHDLTNYLDPWQYVKLNAVERILLSRRLAANTDDIVRNLGEMYDLNPTPRKRFDGLYDTAIAGLGLDDDFEGEKFKRKENQLQESLPELEDARRELKGRTDRSSATGQAGNRFAGIAPPAVAAAPSSRPMTESMSANEKAMDGWDESKNELKPSESRFRSNSEKFGKDAPQKRDQFFGDKLNEEAMFGVELNDGQQTKELQELRKQLQSLYRRLPPTQEWMENNYWHLLPDQQTPELVRVNRFWRDYARHVDGDFLSPYFPEAHQTFTEMMFVLAVIDLPFKSPQPGSDYQENRLTFTATGPTIAFHQQVEPALVDRGNTTILVSENFFAQHDRYQHEDGVQFDKFIFDKFHAHTLYGGQVVITNPTSTPRAIDLLIQIPEGSLPVNGSQATKTISLDLAGFSTQTFEYHFYFPTAGKFSHYPAHVSADEKVLAIAESIAFNVTEQPAEVDQTSWAYVSQNGTGDEVIEFLNSKNILRLDLNKIAFRMSDKAFFQRTIKTLRNRYVYNPLLWSYSLKHNDTTAIREYLSHNDAIAGNVGPYFESELLTIAPVERNWYQHREYWPLVHSRAHQLGPQRKILNPAFYEQYQSLLSVLAHHGKLRDDEHLVVTYYMLLQDRFETALEHFGKTKADSLPCQMQYDYCAAYLDMIQSKPEAAATTAEKWASYPVDLWRERFQNILAQVEEVRGGSATVINAEDQTQKQTALAAQSATFDFSVESGKVTINHQNVAEIDLNLYEMDIELLFSHSPFAQDDLDGFSMIRPNTTETVTLKSDDKGRGSREVPIPDELKNKNVLVEIVAGDQSKSQPYFAHSLDVQISENYGSLQVTQQKTHDLLPQTYVKVYSRDRNGSVKFHKDGYTDLRGRFDFVTQSNHSLDGIEKFSILILSETNGAIIRQVDPPKE